MVPGPIILIEDDEDDKDIIKEILHEIEVPNDVLWFQESEKALSYLKTCDTQPFVIISDINLPGMSGFELKNKIDDDIVLRKKSIPFVFFSTSGNSKNIERAYLELCVQGYFTKANSYAETKQILKTILEYWKLCKHPNSR